MPIIFVPDHASHPNLRFQSKQIRNRSTCLQKNIKFDRQTHFNMEIMWSG